MKSLVLTNAIVFFVFFNMAEGHQQSVHQYITREAFKLLCRSYPQLANSEMASYVGTTETNLSSGDKSWGDGKIVSGAWIEDEYDVVYHYGIGNTPAFHEWAVGPFDELFGGDPRLAFTSITHFWDADAGATSSVTLHDFADVPIVGRTYWSFTCENAMQKMYKYLNGDFDNRDI